VSRIAVLRFSQSCKLRVNFWLRGLARGAGARCMNTATGGWGGRLICAACHRVRSYTSESNNFFCAGPLVPTRAEELVAECLLGTPDQGPGDQGGSVAAASSARERLPSWPLVRGWQGMQLFTTVPPRCSPSQGLQAPLPLPSQACSCACTHSVHCACLQRAIMAACGAMALLVLA
jgi:hypothetical protein